MPGHLLFVSGDKPQDHHRIVIKVYAYLSDFNNHLFARYVKLSSCRITGRAALHNCMIETTGHRHRLPEARTSSSGPRYTESENKSETWIETEIERCASVQAETTVPIPTAAIKPPPGHEKTDGQACGGGGKKYRAGHAE